MELYLARKTAFPPSHLLHIFNPEDEGYKLLWTTRRYIPEDNIHNCRCENFKSYDIKMDY
jgi:hypothetical protein